MARRPSHNLLPNCGIFSVLFGFLPPVGQSNPTEAPSVLLLVGSPVYRSTGHV